MREHDKRTGMMRHLFSLATALLILLLTFAAYAQTSRPVDTLQFGLLDLGMSMAEVRARLGPPAHIKTETRTVLVPRRDGFCWQRHKRDAPLYDVRMTEYERWYYPEGGGNMATVLEFRNGSLDAKTSTGKRRAAKHGDVYPMQDDIPRGCIGRHLPDVHA
jgi:hypothetical protein